MRLLINAVGLRAGGGLTVGLNAIRGIRQLRPEYDILALVPAGQGYEELCADLAITHKAFPRTPGYAAWRVWFDQVQVPLTARRWSADVLFTMNNQAAWSAGCPQVLMFHNPHYIYPVAEWWPLLSTFDRASLLVQRALFALSARRCACVVAQTAVAAKRLHEQYGIGGARLATVPNAVAPEHHCSETDGGHRITVRMREVARGRVPVLTLARYYPHKDLEFIVRVARRLRETGDRDFVFFITIAPDQHPGAQALLETIDRERLAENVVNLGPISFDELRGVYAAARVCFLASVLESMSGAYLEALQYGLPIVTTDRDFAREACGVAGRYFPPGDVEAAIQQLHAAAMSGSGRDERGHQVSGLRSWSDVCNDLVAILDSIQGHEHVAGASHGSEDLRDCCS